MNDQRQKMIRAIGSVLVTLSWIGIIILATLGIFSTGNTWSKILIMGGFVCLIGLGIFLWAIASPKNVWPTHNHTDMDRCPTLYPLIILFFLFGTACQAQDDPMTRDTAKPGGGEISKRLDSVRKTVWLNKNLPTPARPFNIYGALGTDGGLSHISGHFGGEILIDAHNFIYLFGEVGTNQASLAWRKKDPKQKPALFLFHLGPRIESPFVVSNGLNGFTAFIQIGFGLAARDGYKPQGSYLIKSGFGTRDNIMFFISFTPPQNRASLGFEGNVIALSRLSINIYTAVNDFISLIGNLKLKTD